MSTALDWLSFSGLYSWSRSDLPVVLMYLFVVADCALQLESGNVFIHQSLSPKMSVYMLLRIPRLIATWRSVLVVLSRTDPSVRTDIPL